MLWAAVAFIAVVVIYLVALFSGWPVVAFAMQIAAVLVGCVSLLAAMFFVLGHRKSGEWVPIGDPLRKPLLLVAALFDITAVLLVCGKILGGFDYPWVATVEIGAVAVILSYLVFLVIVPPIVWRGQEDDDESA